MILKMLELSTANITKETDSWLTSELSDVIPPLSIFSKGEGKDQTGWFILVPEKNEWENNPNEFENVSQDLITVINFALSQDCTWIMFDKNADSINELPKFDWK